MGASILWNLCSWLPPQEEAWAWIWFCFGWGDGGALCVRPVCPLVFPSENYDFVNQSSTMEDPGGERNFWLLLDHMEGHFPPNSFFLRACPAQPASSSSSCQPITTPHYPVYLLLSFLYKVIDFLIEWNWIKGEYMKKLYTIICHEELPLHGRMNSQGE